ncbi:MAG: SDR family oxidoreductase [Planctomycetota bacterium]
MRRFHEQSVLITGASAGIGAALARAFAHEGARLTLLARREDRLAVLARELEAQGTRTLVQRCDVTQDGELEAAADVAREAFGGLDVVVANAGFGVVGQVCDLTLDDFRRQFETNVFGVLRTVQATVPDLRRSRGRLALVGSVAGWIARPGGAPYSMSKFAVRALADSLRLELQPDGVAVTLISPGFIESEIRQVDNRGQHHEGKADKIPAWLRMPADECAQHVLRAIARREREAVITGHGKALVYTERFAPWLLRGIGRAMPGKKWSGRE